MLLQRLVDYARRDQTSLPFHRVRRFEWQLRIDNHGRLLSDRLERILEPAENEKSKPRGVEHTVPVMVRSMGVAANLAACNTSWAGPPVPTNPAAWSKPTGLSSS